MPNNLTSADRVRGGQTSSSLQSRSSRGTFTGKIPVAPSTSPHPSIPATSKIPVAPLRAQCPECGGNHPAASCDNKG